MNPSTLPRRRVRDSALASPAVPGASLAREASGSACVAEVLARVAACWQGGPAKPTQVDQGLRVRADAQGLARALTLLAAWVTRQQASRVHLHWRAIRQGGRACISLHGAGVRPVSAALSPALQVREQAVHQALQVLGASWQRTAIDGASLLHQVWLPLADNDPLHPEPAWAARALQA